MSFRKYGGINYAAKNNIVHNINIRQLLSDNNKKTIIVPIENETLEVVDSFNRNNL